MEKVIGINEEKMKKLILDIYDYRDKISKILNEIETDFIRCGEYYKSDDGERVKKNLNKICYNFDNCLSIIKNYAVDLEKVLDKYKKDNYKIINVFENR